MDCFYDKQAIILKEIPEKNEIGQLIKKYKKLQSIKCDIQPIDERAYKYTWGYDIKSTMQIFCNEHLKVNSKLIILNTVYQVEKIVPWDDYSIYALFEVDVEVENGN